MAIELDSITSGYSTEKINNNFQKLEEEINNNLLRRDGLGVGEGNQMENPLDMNSFDILNVNNLDVQGFSIQGQSIDGFVSRAETAAEKSEASALASAESEANALISENNASDHADYAEAQAIRAEEAADSSDAVILRTDLANSADPEKGAALAGRASVTVGSLAALAAVPVDKKLSAILVSGGRSGTFYFDSSDLSSEVSADTQQGIYVAPASDPTGASGAWVRQYGQSAIVSPEVSATWFGFGEEPDSSDNLSAALAHSKHVHIPAGTFSLSSVTLPSGTKISTAGFETVLQQVSGTAAGTRMIIVGGSNVEIGSMTVRGNIATDTDEQNHAIYIQANATTGDIHNVIVGDIHGEDIRGDVVYFGQATGALYKLTNVQIGHITFDNVYRNGVSCVSCDGFSVKSVTGTRCGFTHMDVEANVGSGPCVNGTIGYVKGRCFGLVSPAAADYIDNITIQTLDLSPDHAAQSVPSYAPGVAVEDGLLLRNVRSAEIGVMRATGFNRCAAFVTYSGGEIGCEYLKIGKLYMRDNLLTDATYNSYVNFVTLPSNHLEIGKLDVVVSGSNKRAISGLRSGFIGNIYADVQSSASAMRDCQNVQVGSIVQSGTGGRMIESCVNCSVGGGSFSGDRLASNSTKCRFENFTATAAVFLFSSGQENHVIVNSTLNGDYYGYGVGIRAHTMPQRFGAYNLWVDSTGDLRIKGGTPTSDTDGVVVGTQS